MFFFLILFVFPSDIQYNCTANTDGKPYHGIPFKAARYMDLAVLNFVF
jgi:hypothetical protein